jgi:tight adherence protein B
MVPDQLVLIYGAVFLAVLLLVEGTLLVLRDARRRAERTASRRARLQAATPGARITPVQLRRHTARQSRGPVAAIARMLEQSGASMSAPRLLLISAVLGTGIWAVIVYTTPASPILAMLPAFSLGFALPLLFVARKRRRRVKRFAEQLPDALDMMVRSLRAGHPIRAAMSLVAKEMADPIGPEFGIAVDEMTYGLELDEALANLCHRVPYSDLHYTVVAINIQHASGGNLAEVLANLSTIIRDRHRLYKKVRALSAEGRLSGYVIAGVPFFIAFMMTINKADYYTSAASHPAFPIVVVAAVVLYIGSILAIYKIVNIRV